MGSTLAYWRVLARVSGIFLEGFIYWKHRTLRDYVEPQGGDFRGSAISENLSGLSPFLE